MILGREGIHRWSAAGGQVLELNRLYTDVGERLPSYVRIREISGLHGLGEAEDRRDLRVGADGEIPRLSRRRGKTLTYEGIVRTPSARDLRFYQSILRVAFGERSEEGRMDVFPHPLNPEFGADEAKRYYRARVLGLEMQDVRSTQRFESTFVLALRLSDARYFDADTDLPVA